MRRFRNQILSAMGMGPKATILIALALPACGDTGEIKDDDDADTTDVDADGWGSGGTTGGETTGGTTGGQTDGGDSDGGPIDTGSTGVVAA